MTGSILPPTDLPNAYAALSQERRVQSALEMAHEITEEKERMYAVALALLSRLTPAAGDDHIEVGAFRLAEVLEEMLANCAQHYRMIECVEAMGAQS
mgnify:CR=1 FL=1